MEWLSQNWFWVVIAVLFIVVHFFGHGGHGGHGGRGGGHGGCGGHGDREQGRSSDKPAGHQH